MFHLFSSAAVLSWLTETLAVGGRFPIERASDLASSYGLRAVVDLRAECCDDADALRRCGLDFLHLPTCDQRASEPAMLDQGVAFVTAYLSRGEKTLIHCEHGIGRSALLALCVLVERGEAPLDALRLAKERRAAISPSAAQYDGWIVWLRKRGHRPPSFDAFAAIAYHGARD